MRRLRVLQAYEQHAAEWDAEFRATAEDFGERIQCRKGCSACCGQMFTISPLEAEYLAAGVTALSDEARARLRQAAHDYLAECERRGLGGGPDEPGGTVTPRPGAGLPCPALVDGACSIYHLRPLICRKWGIPLFDPRHPDRLQACELNFSADEPIEGRALIARQAALLEKWVGLKQEAGTTPRDRRMTIAEALLVADR